MKEGGHGGKKTGLGWIVQPAGRKRGMVPDYSVGIGEQVVEIEAGKIIK
jgi:hypothetical protein